MKTAPEIRPARPEDLTSLSKLVNSAYRGESSKIGWTTEADMLDGQRTDPKTLLDMILDPSNVILLMLEAGQLIACVFLRRQERSAYLGMLTVDPVLQAAGVGRRLLTASELWVKEQWNAQVMEMQVISKRDELIAWYERRGYKGTGERKPFPYNDERFGIPKVDGLEFVILAKDL